MLCQGKRSHASGIARQKSRSANGYWLKTILTARRFGCLWVRDGVDRIVDYWRYLMFIQWFDKHLASDFSAFARADPSKRFSAKARAALMAFAV